MIYISLLFYIFSLLYLTSSSSKLTSIIIGLPSVTAFSIYLIQAIYHREFVSFYPLTLFIIFNFIFMVLFKKWISPLLENNIMNSDGLSFSNIEKISYVLIFLSFTAIVINFDYINLLNYFVGKGEDTQSGIGNYLMQTLIFPKIAVSSGVALLYLSIKNKKTIKWYILSFLQILPVLIISILGYRRSEIYHLFSPFIIFSVFSFAPYLFRNVLKTKIQVFALLLSMIFISGFSIEYTAAIRQSIKNCGQYGECNLNLTNINNLYYGTTSVDYRRPGESINIDRVMNKLYEGRINHDYGFSTLNMMLFRFAPSFIIGENLREKVRESRKIRHWGLIPYTTHSGMSCSILSFGYLAPIKWVFTTLFFIPFLNSLKKNIYYLIIALPPMSSVIGHMFTHNLDLVAPDLITIFLTFKIIGFLTGQMQRLKL